jgi:hypothetical protein
VTAAFDNRLVTLSFTLANGETITYDQEYYIACSGTKFGNSNLADMELRIDNIAINTRNNIITQTSPLNLLRTPVNVQLLVGRRSFGAFVLFQGGVVATNPTQPPDIGLTMRSLMLVLQLTNPIKLTAPAQIKLSVLAAQVAQQLGVKLSFQATDKMVDNYSFTGAALKQVEKIAEAGNYTACIDNDTLVVLNNGQARNKTPIQVNSSTGMIGVPELTDFGVRVRMLINSQVQILDQIQVTSAINPSANGTYIITQLRFEISTWETPFYWIMEAKPPQYFAGQINQ